MRIPEAQERSINTAPNVGGLPNPSMEIIDTGVARAGKEFQNAMQNASQGFVKMYLADQRADAIDAYDEYNKRLKELLDSGEEVNPATGEPISDKSKIDPENGLPIGFKQLRGDQINENNLQTWQNKAISLRQEFDKKIKGFVPDIKKEFSRRADQEDQDFSLQINSYFLKGKYDRAASAAKRDNENIMTNTVIGVNDADKIGGYYQQLYNNNFTATQDKAASETLAKQQVEKLIENNVKRIRRTGVPTAYDDVRKYINSPGISKHLSETSKDALLHDNDLEDVKWQMHKQGMTTGILRNHIKNKITNLSPEEKEVFIAEQIKLDTKREGGIDAKKVSDFEELVSVVGNGQPEFFIGNNKYGITIPEGLTEAENIQFQSAFLTFADSVLGGLTFSNSDRVRAQGLSAILPEPQIKAYTSGQYGKLMAVAYKRVDDMFKNGQLSTLNSQQTNYLKSIISGIRQNNYNFGQQAEYRRNLEYDINQFADKAKSGSKLTPEEMEKAMSDLNNFETLYGTEAAKYGDSKFMDNKIFLQRQIEKNLVPSMSDARGFLNSHINANFFRKAGNWFFGFGDTIKTGMNKADVNRNLNIIDELTVLANADGKMPDGRRNIVPVIAKEIRDMGWQMMHGDGLTVMRVRGDGTIDTSVTAKGVVFPMDKYINPGENRPTNTSRNMYEIETKFIRHLNQKYGSNKYSILNTDLNQLPAEDVSYLQELTRREILSKNGYPNATYAQLTELPLSLYREDSMMTKSLESPWTEKNLSYNPNRVSAVLKTREESNKVGQYVGSLEKDLSFLKGSDFLGGRASNADMAALISEGYSSYEDMTFMRAVKNPIFTPSEMTNMALESLAPFGSRGGYLENVAFSLGFEAKTKKEKELIQVIDGIQKEQKELVSEITKRLANDNPDMTEEDFLKPNTIGYNVSSDTLKFATERYLQIRPKINAALREIYMMTGAAGIDKTSFAKEEMSKAKFANQFEGFGITEKISH